MLNEYVVGFMFNAHRNRVLLIKKTHPHYQAGFLNGIGGKIEATETPIQAMIREFKEEANLETYELTWKQFCILTIPDHTRIYFFYSVYSQFEHEQWDNNVSGFYYNKKENKEVPVVFYMSRGERYPDLKLFPDLKWLLPLAIDCHNQEKDGIFYSMTRKDFNSLY